MRPMSEKEWQAKDDLHTLKRAEEIKKNRARMSAAKAQAKKEMNNLKKFAGSQGVAPRPKRRMK